MSDPEDYSELYETKERKQPDYSLPETPQEKTKRLKRQVREMKDKGVELAVIAEELGINWYALIRNY